MVVERGAFYVADPVNLKASFTYPATSLVTFLFQPFGRWAEWACLAALDTLALACVGGRHRFAAFPLVRFGGSLCGRCGAALFLPGSRAGGLRHPVCECHGGPAHGHAVRGHPLPVFRHRTASWVLLADGAAAGIADADQGYLFCYGLIAAFLIGLDWLAAGEGPFRKRLGAALLHAGGLAVAVVAAFLSWSRYTAAVTPTVDTAASVGSAGSATARC